VQHSSPAWRSHRRARSPTGSPRLRPIPVPWRRATARATAPPAARRATGAATATPARGTGAAQPARGTERARRAVRAHRAEQARRAQRSREAARERARRAAVSARTTTDALGTARRTFSSLTAVRIATSRDDDGRTLNAVAGTALLALAAAGGVTLSRARRRVLA
jgi:hypothetical protein